MRQGAEKGEGVGKGAQGAGVVSEPRGGPARRWHEWDGALGILVGGVPSAWMLGLKASEQQGWMPSCISWLRQR